VGCGKEGDYICPECAQKLPFIDTAVCPRCGIPSAYGYLCPHCVSWQSSIDGIRAPFRFEGVIREAIHKMKYQNLTAIVPQLAIYLRDFWLAQSLEVDILIPVPLHRRRLRERGYNQSALLARELSRLMGIPVDEKSLTRARHTLPQARTESVAERQRNVIGLFACNPEKVKDRKILLIDDVTTTGATLDACAEVLKHAGAAAVWGLALAKEI